MLPPGAAQPPAPFEGRGLAGDVRRARAWKGWRETPFAGHGEVHCQAGVIVLSMGDPFTGINWTNEFPKMNYEVALDAMRLMGSDFFCGLTVPVGTNCCSLIVGGWGGSLVGISSLDGMDASENETTKFTSFESGRWYRIRLRVTEKKIEAWIDKDKLVDVDTRGPADLRAAGRHRALAAVRTGGVADLGGAARDQVPAGERAGGQRGLTAKTRRREVRTAGKRESTSSICWKGVGEVRRYATVAPGAAQRAVPDQSLRDQPLRPTERVSRKSSIVNPYTV